MAVNYKDIEILWKQYSEDAVNKGISVVQFFESNGAPYHCFEKWYKKKYSKTGIVDCVVSGSPDGMRRRQLAQYRAHPNVLRMGRSIPKATTIG